jgi:pSer/pThr/pTyr-binding forkhead associated (FHA) protein
MWVITDHGRNGTVVNGQKLQPGALHSLSDGDRIDISDAVLVFCFQLDPVKVLPQTDKPPT